MNYGYRDTVISFYRSPNRIRDAAPTGSATRHV